MELIDGVEISYTARPSASGCELPTDTDVLVILATERYFTSRTSGYSSEYLYAKERGITVIPLLLEDGIINLINTRCDKSQYIEASASLDDALSALRSRILSLNLSEAPEHRHRIFISYRKKDAEALRLLVDALESIPVSNDLSFWYDAAISPGENYEERITDALCGCDIFILLVTPSLLEADNFVMCNEYPMARRLGKRILPLEAVKTDRRALRELFSGLPDPIPLKQIRAIEAELLRLKAKLR